MSDAVISRSAVIAGRGARDLSLLRPVRAGAVLTGAVTVLECDLVSEDAGNVIMRGTLSDEAQETMVVIHIDALIRRRGA
jgi:acyl dehydratase